MRAGCRARLLGNAWAGAAVDCVLDTETADAFVASVCAASTADGVVLCCPVVTGYESWVARTVLGLRVHVALDALAAPVAEREGFSEDQLADAVRRRAARVGPHACPPVWERPPTRWFECPVVINHKALRVLGRDDATLPTPYLAAWSCDASAYLEPLRIQSQHGGVPSASEPARARREQDWGTRARVHQ